MIINFAGGIYSIADVWYKVMLQILLDYVLAMPLLAVAGIFYKPFKDGRTVKEKNSYLLVGTVCAILAQFVAYFLSGVLFRSSSLLCISSSGVSR